MRKSQELAIALSETREAINKAEPDADVAELRKRSLALEADWRDAVRAEAKADAEAERQDPADGDAEARELADLAGKVECRAYFESVIGGGKLEGREGELNGHLGLQGNQIPWAALTPLEERVDATTNPPAGTQVPQQSILERVFARSDTMFLGVPMPSVAVGEPSYPVFATGATGAAVAKGAAGADAVAASITASAVSPGRIQARYRFGIEGAATFVGLESTLRSDLTMALSEAHDAQLWTDLLGANGLTNPTDPTAVATWQSVVDDMNEQVDGRYAMMVDELRLAVGAPTFQLFGKTYQQSGATEQTEASINDKMSMILGGYRVSAHVPAAASNIQNAIVALGMHRAAVCPVWEGVRLIRDEVTRANQGEVVLTAVMLRGFQMLRQDAMKRLEFKLA